MKITSNVCAGTEFFAACRIVSERVGAWVCCAAEILAIHDAGVEVLVLVVVVGVEVVGAAEVSFLVYEEAGTTYSLIN